MTGRANFLTVVGVLCVVASTAGCGGSFKRLSAPTVPSGVTNPAPIDRPVVSSSNTSPAAILVASTFTATRGRPFGVTSFELDLRLQLTETGQKSGAFVRSVTAYFLEGSRLHLTDYGCGVGSDKPAYRVPAGGTWDMTQMGYCAPSGATSASIDTATIKVEFVDDDGVPGVLMVSTKVE